MAKFSIGEIAIYIGPPTSKWGYGDEVKIDWVSPGQWYAIDGFAVAEHCLRKKTYKDQFKSSGQSFKDLIAECNRLPDMSVEYKRIQQYEAFKTASSIQAQMDANGWKLRKFFGAE